MDMHVYANRRQAKADRNRQIRRFPAHARKAAKLLYRIWDHITKLFRKHFWQRLQMTGLYTIESNRENKSLYFLHGKPLQIRRPKAFSCGRSKKTLHCTRRAGILRARRENRPHQNTKRIVRLRLDKLDYRSAVRAKFALKSFINFFNSLNRQHL